VGPGRHEHFHDPTCRIVGRRAGRAPFLRAAFLQPADERLLVEIVRPTRRARQHLRPDHLHASHRQAPIVVRDSPGFLVNRLLLPYLNEALEMICQGIDLAAIDRAGRRLAWDSVAFEMLDLIGVDTAMRAGRTMWEASRAVSR